MLDKGLNLFLMTIGDTLTQSLGLLLIVAYDVVTLPLRFVFALLSVGPLPY